MVEGLINDDGNALMSFLKKKRSPR